MIKIRKEKVCLIHFLFFKYFSQIKANKRRRRSFTKLNPDLNLLFKSIISKRRAFVVVSALNKYGAKKEKFRKKKKFTINKHNTHIFLSLLRLQMYTWTFLCHFSDMCVYIKRESNLIKQNYWSHIQIHFCSAQSEVSKWLWIEWALLNIAFIRL